MIMQCIDAALSYVNYEIVDDDGLCYDDMAHLPCVWATGKTREEYRKNLAEIVDGRFVVKLKRWFLIPQIDYRTINELQRSVTLMF